MKELAKDSDLPKPRDFDIPMEDTGVGSASSSILLPHEMFHYLFHNAKGWASSILPDQRLLPKFWKSFKGHPCMESHPVLARPSFQDYCIPLSLHGDETPITGVGKIWCHKALLLTWSSLIAIAGGNSSEDCNLYIHGLFEKFITPTTESTIGTMQAIWLILKWSFTAIWNGTWPSVDAWGRKYPPSSAEGRRAGQKLANGYYGCLVQLCGDLDYYASYLDVPRWSSHAKPCSQCRCSFEGDLSWLDNRSVAQWQNSLLSPHNWKTHWESRSALFELPGMSSCSLAMDMMHCLFLGWLQYVYGSVISLLVFECYDGDDYLGNLHQVGIFIRTFQAQHKMKHRYRRRLNKLTMFQSGDKFPKLRGKAAEIQSLALTMWTLWKNKMNPEIDQHRLIEFFLKFNVEIDQILNDFHPRYGFLSVPLQEAKHLYSRGMQMAQIHCQLMTFYKNQGIKLFNLTSKTHFVLHSLFNARWLHPSLVWCYKGEDQMQRVAKLWKSCLEGSKHWQVAKRAVWKERHLLFLRNKVGWEKKRASHSEVFYPTCVTSLPSLLVRSTTTCPTCVVLNISYVDLLLVIIHNDMNSMLKLYLCHRKMMATKKKKAPRKMQIIYFWEKNIKIQGNTTNL